jgi:hypothetical protein
MPDWITLAATLAGIAGNLALVGTVILLIREIRENNKLNRAANSQAMVGLSSPFYMALIQDRKLAELYAQGADAPHDFDAVDRIRYQYLLLWWLIFYENIYYQRRQKLLDSRAFEPWRRDLVLFLRRHNVVAHWGELKHLLQAEFAEEIGRMLAEGGKAP